MGNKVMWFVVIIVLVAGGWYFVSHRNSEEANEYGPDAENGEMMSPSPSSSSDMMHNDASSGDAMMTESPAASPNTTTSSKVDVTLTSSGFTPNTVTIKKGQTVVWTNESGSNMWVASAVHPTHTAYDGTSLQEHCQTSATAPFDQCQSGDSYSFTFDKVGTWKYHNHMNSSETGTIVVQ